MCSKKITISHGNIRVAVKVHFVRIWFYLCKDSDESTRCFLTRKMSVSASAFVHGKRRKSQVKLVLEGGQPDVPWCSGLAWWVVVTLLHFFSLQSVCFMISGGWGEFGWKIEDIGSFSKRFLVAAARERLHGLLRSSFGKETGAERPCLSWAAAVCALGSAQTCPAPSSEGLQGSVPAASRQARGAAISLFVLPASHFVSVIIWLLKFLLCPAKECLFQRKSQQCVAV